jgi:hypothetical protein
MRSGLSIRARFRIAHVLVPLAFLGLLLTLYLVSGPPRAGAKQGYLIDRAAWGSRQNSGSGRWLVLGPKGDRTSQIGFDTVWTRVRVEDHQAFRAPFAPAARVEECKTTFETEGLRVTAHSCRRGIVHIAIRNDLDQPRLVLVEGH